MGLKFYSRDYNHSKEFLTLASNVDQPYYVNTSVSYYKTYHCTSGLLPYKTYSIKPNIDLHPYASIEKRRPNDQSMKKNRCLSPNGIYENLLGFTRNSIKTQSNTQMTIHKPILYENSNHEHYENLRLSPLTIPLKLNDLICYENIPTDKSSSYSSSHTYMNLSQDVDKISIIPISSYKDPCFTIGPLEDKQVDIDRSSNTNTIQIAKKLEVNLAPSCRDKSVLYRTKMPNFTTSIPSSSFRQRRRSTRSKRHSQRNIKSSPQITRNSNTNQSKLPKQHHSKLDLRKRSPTIIDKQLKQSLPKLPSKQSPSSELYQEIEQSSKSDHQSEHNSIYSEAEVCEHPINLHTIWQSQVLAWHPIDAQNEEELIAKFSFTTEQDEFDQEDQISIDNDNDELCRHETFEDFFLRRPQKSSCSTVHNGTSPVISETLSNPETPIEPSKLDNRGLNSISLGLDKNDVEFIHDIIERSYGDRRKSNRIIALREAYIRALNNKLKTQTVRQNHANEKKQKVPVKDSYIASKVRNELEQYDELPIGRILTFDDNDAYSFDYRHQTQQCTIPAVVSTMHRILNFVVSVKRQVQKNLQDIRSRINTETMSHHSTQHRRTVRNPSTFSHHHRSRPKKAHSHSNTRSKTNHRPSEQCHPVQRHQHCRPQSNKSHVQTPNQTLNNEQRLSYRPRTFRVISHRQRLPRID